MGKKSKKTKKKSPVFIFLEDMPDYSNEPAFIKKAEENIEFLKRVGLPESYVKEYGMPDFLKGKQE